MPDAFDLLGLPRRPWLEPGEVRRAFQERARALHPDAEGGGDAEKFAELNAAQSVLADPASRLKLLAGGLPVPAMPPDPELGFRLAATLRRADELSSREVSTALTRALAASDRSALLREIEDVAREVRDMAACAEERLRCVDGGDSHALAALAGEFTFLNRWDRQIRERRIALQLLGSPAADIR